MHHCVTNEWDRDPVMTCKQLKGEEKKKHSKIRFLFYIFKDVTHMPLLAVTEKMFLDARAKKLGRIESVLVRYLVIQQKKTKNFEFFCKFFCLMLILNLGAYSTYYVCSLYGICTIQSLHSKYLSDFNTNFF